MPVKTIKQIKNLKNKRVLLRVDFNVPIKNGRVLDDLRLRASMPTIEYLLKKGARVILVSHLGRPKGIDKKLSLRPVAKRLRKIFNFPLASPAGRFPIYNQFPISNFQTAKKEIDKMKSGQVIMLENIRFFSGETKNDSKFSKELADLADIFVLDGFAVAHRESASVTGVTKYLPSYAGFLIEEEIKNLSKLLQKPKQPFVVVLGGAKIETKVPVLKTLLPKADFILLGGGLFNTYLGSLGYKLGKSVHNKDYFSEIKKYCKNKKVIMPVDVVVGKKDGKKNRILKMDKNFKLKRSELIFDIGPETIHLYAGYIKKAQTLVWNGAVGYFEQKPYDVGTLSIARLVGSRAKGKAYGVIGGGETIQTMDMVKMIDNIDFVSTGGGAMLEFLSGKELPGLKALTK